MIASVVVVVLTATEKSDDNPGRGEGNDSLCLGSRGTEGCGETLSALYPILNNENKKEERKKEVIYAEGSR